LRDGKTDEKPLKHRSGRVYLLSPLALISPQIASTTLTHLNTAFASSSASKTLDGPKKVPDAKWVRPTEDERDRGILIIVEVAGTPKQITWHRKGDYFATVSVDGECTCAVSGHAASRGGLMRVLDLRRVRGSCEQVRLGPSGIETSDSIALQEDQG
jgi:ribosome biogenesis protein ERB1